MDNAISPIITISVPIITFIVLYLFQFLSYPSYKECKEKITPKQIAKIDILSLVIPISLYVMILLIGAILQIENESVYVYGILTVFILSIVPTFVLTAYMLTHITANDF